MHIPTMGWEDYGKGDHIVLKKKVELKCTEGTTWAGLVKSVL